VLRIGVRAGLSPSEIWELTWFEFRAVAEAVQEVTVHDFNVMRHGASLNLLAHVDKKHRKQIMPDKLFPLPSDKPQEVRTLSDDEARMIIAQMTRRLINYEEVN
jgi:hypothetical protein